MPNFGIVRKLEGQRKQTLTEVDFAEGGILPDELQDAKIDLSPFASLTVFLPAGAALDGLWLYVSPNQSGPYVPLQDCYATVDPEQAGPEGIAVALPAICHGVGFAVLVADAQADVYICKAT